MRGDFLVRRHFVDVQPLVGQRRGDGVDDAGIVGTFQLKVPGICDDAEEEAAKEGREHMV